MNCFKNKTILITGATGLIGSHLVSTFMKMGDVKVVAMSRDENKLKMGFKEYLCNSNFEYIASDVCNDFSCIDRKIDYVFHAAGPMESKIIANVPMDVINPNLIGTINCINLLKKSEQKYGEKGRLILFSSVTVYSNNTNYDKIVTEEDTNVTEKLEGNGAPYSQSKRMAEVIARASAKQYGIDVVIARLSTVYGNTIFRPDTAFFQFINSSLKGENIVMNSSGIGRRDNIYIDDAVDGLIQIAKSGKSGEAYNISSNGDKGNYAAVDEIAQAIVAYVNEKNGYNEMQFLNVLYKDGGSNARKPGLKLDNTKLKNLGWTLKIDLREGIKRTIDSIISEGEND